MKKIFLLSVFCLIFFSSSCFASFDQPWIFVQDLHLVRHGETLDSIAKDFMKKNTYEKREIHEFKSGIIELNPWLLERNVKYLDIIFINYWIKNNEKEVE